MSLELNNPGLSSKVAAELFRSFGDSFGNEGGEKFREEFHNSDLDDCSSDEEQNNNGMTDDSPKRDEKKKHWVDPERQVDKDLLAVCQGRVRRRAELIDTIRRAYLQDVVLLKSVIMSHFNEVQVENIARQWRDAIPSLDVRQLFWLHAPDETTLAVLPCKTCGGSVELMHHDSPEIERLTKLVNMQENQTHDLKILVATQKAKLETVEFQLQDLTNSHLKEKAVMFGKMKDLREQAAEAEGRGMRSLDDLKQTSLRLERLENATADYKEIVEAKKRLEIENINLTTALGQKSDALVKESGLLSKATEEIMVLKKQAIANQTEISKSQAQIECLNVNVLKLTKVYEQAEARYEKTQGFLDDLKKEYAQLESTKNSLAIDLSILEENTSREIEQFEARLASLRAQNNRLTTDLSNVRNLADVLKTKLELENPDALNDVNEHQVFRLQDELATAQAQIEQLKAFLENVPMESFAGNITLSSLRSVETTNSKSSTKPSGHSDIDEQAHQNPSQSKKASTSCSTRKKIAPSAIVTKQTSDEIKREAVAWKRSAAENEDDVPPAPEVAHVSLNDTPHPERLIKPFFQSFASEDNDMVAEQDECSSESDSDSEVFDEAINMKKEKRPAAPSKGGMPPPTPKRSGGGGFDREPQKENTAISPGSLPAGAALNRRKSISFAEQARSDSIKEVVEMKPATLKYKLVKRKVKKVMKIKRVMKVWIKKKRNKIQKETSIAPLDEKSVNAAGDSSDPACAVVQHENSLEATAEMATVLVIAKPSAEEVVEQQVSALQSDIDIDKITSPLLDQEVNSIVATAVGSPAKTDDEGVIDAPVVGSPRKDELNESSFNTVKAVDATAANIPSEDSMSAHTVAAPTKDEFPEISGDSQAEALWPNVIDAVDEYLLSAPPIEEMGDYDEIDREVEVEVEEEVEEVEKTPLADEEVISNDIEVIEEIVMVPIDPYIADVVSESNPVHETSLSGQQDDESIELLPSKSKRRRLKTGTPNENGTINMPARREYVAVPKNKQDGGKVRIAVPKAKQRNTILLTSDTPAPAFYRIKETGMSTEMLDPHGDDDLEFESQINEHEDGSADISRLWGTVMTDLRKTLRQSECLKGQHDLIKAIITSIGPRLRAVCAQYSKTQIALWRTMKATKTTCDFVSAMRPAMTGLLNTINVPSSVKKSDIEVIYTAVLQSRDREMKGIAANPEKTKYAPRDVLRPWAQGIDIDHETIGALTESCDLAIIGGSNLNSDGFVSDVLPSITAAEYFGDDPDTRDLRTELAIKSADSMIGYEKMAMKDLTHLVLRFLDQTKIKQIELLGKINVLEKNAEETARREAENKERIARNGIVEIKEAVLDGFKKDRKKLEEVVKVLAIEKEKVASLREGVSKVELELFTAERKLEEIPELQEKLVLVNGVQTETQKQLADTLRDLKCAAAMIEEKNELLEATRVERGTLQKELSEKMNQIDRLDVDLAGMTELQRFTEDALRVMKEIDRVRQGKHSSVSCQHTPDKSFSIDVGIQTEFIYPPLTLRQRLGSAFPGNSSNRMGSGKIHQRLFPAITVSCPLDDVNAFSASNTSRSITSVGSRYKQYGGDSFLSMSQSVSSLVNPLQRKGDSMDIDLELASLFGGASIRDQNKMSRTAESRNPTYDFGVLESRDIRTTGNQPSHRAIGLSLPLVAASDGKEDHSVSETPALLDSDRSLRSHLSVANETDGRVTQYQRGLTVSFNAQTISDDICPEGNNTPGHISSEINMNCKNSRVLTAYAPPQSPIRNTNLMSYTEQLLHSQQTQADSIKPQMNALSPLILQGQPRSYEDLIHASPSRKNGGRARTTAAVHAVNGISLQTCSINNSSSDSLFSQGSDNTTGSKNIRGRGESKIITGVPGHDPMSVSAYRRFVGTSTGHKNKYI